MSGIHVVVDGSNIATEGRTAPSLVQLDEAVRAFLDQHKVAHVTVVVDATFPNRIDRKERTKYEDAVDAGEIITPPAGAIGRGDAFILEIADRAGATILSNDSFQEFHGKFLWLFDDGRLIGGKPVPHVGWVFMERMPVRGATSRKAVSAARKGSGRAEKAKAAPARASKRASEPMPTPKQLPPRVAKAAKAAAKAATAPLAVTAKAAASDDTTTGRRRRTRGRSESALEPYNEPLPFLEFVSSHPPGSIVEGTVDRFASHGAYVALEGILAYAPLRNLGDPPPRSARTVLRPGVAHTFVVQALDAPRRGVDLAIPGVVPVPALIGSGGAASHPVQQNQQEERVTPVKKAAKRTAKKATKKRAPARKAAKKATKKRAPARKAAKKATKKATKKRAPARKAAKKSAKKATKKRAPARKAAKKATKKRAPARKAAKKATKKR